MSLPVRQALAPAPLRRPVLARPSRSLLVLTLLALVAVVALVANLALGEFAIGPAEVVRSLAGAGDPSHEFVVVELRLPRALLAFAVGAALAVSGAILQGLTRNPLAAPDIVGVSAGANAAAVLVIVALPSAPVTLLPVAAFAGALAASVIVYLLAWDRGSSPSRLLLVGIGVTTVSYAVVIGVISTVDELIHASQLVTYLAGSVYGKGWPELRALLPWLAVLLPLALAGARHLDALSLGDPVARGLGVPIERRRLGLLCVGTALAASAVAIAGPVGFVGLTAPHIARRLVGAAHADRLPAALLAGGAMTIVADALARTAFAPVDIPVGVVTAVVGAPYLVWLLSRERRGGAAA
jgi:iron complex transport system permease protein